MKTFKHLFTLTLFLSTLSLWAQFGGPGGGGGWGGGRPGGGGPGGRPGSRPEQTTNPNRQLPPEQSEPATASGPKIGSVAGTVVDENKVPIEYATIAVIDAKTQKVITGGITNVKGRFSIKQIPAGDYRIRITFIGFHDYTGGDFSLSSSRRSEDIGTVVLKENVNMLDEVVVVADVTTIENRID